MNNSDYIVHYKKADGSYRVWYSKTEEIITLVKIPKNISQFYITKGYDPTDTDLRRYGKDLYDASEELKKSKVISFDYISPYFMKDKNDYMFRSHTSNIESIFKMKCKGKYEHHQDINMIESSWFDKCYNGGLIYTVKGCHNCYGYDYSNYYASILSSDDFIIPICKGKEQYIRRFQKKIKTGFYNVFINSDDPTVQKIFPFSDNHVYTSISLKFALELQKTYDISIELNLNCKKNCYIYPFYTLDENEKKINALVSGDKIFKRWYNTIIELKKEFPNNMLTKLLSSSLWGHLSKKNKIYKSEEEGDKLLNDPDNPYDILETTHNNDGTMFYTLIHTQQPYKYNIRLKPFITAYGRIKTAKTALMQIDDVLRIHTDGIIFSKPFEHNIQNFIPEKKTTGQITFNNINDYIKH